MWWCDADGRDDYSTSSGTINTSGYANLTAYVEADGDTSVSISKSTSVLSFARIVWTWSGPPGTAPGLDCSYEYQGYAWAYLLGTISYDADSSASVDHWVYAHQETTAMANGDSDDSYFGSSLHGIAAKGSQTDGSAQAYIGPELQGDETSEEWNPDDDYFDGSAQSVGAEHDAEYEVASGVSVFVLCCNSDCEIEAEVAAESVYGQSAAALAYDGYAECNGGIRDIVVTQK